MEEKKEFNVETLLKKIVVPIVLIVVLICIVMSVIDFFKISYVDEEKVYNYQQQVAQYLQDKYDEEFNIEFLKKGYKKNVSKTGDGGVISSGKDKNVIEYLYKFYPKNNEDISCYIAYWYDKGSGDSEISELRYKKQISVKCDEITYYGEYVNDNKTLEIVEALKKLLGDEYTIDYNLKNSINSIHIKINKNLKTVFLEDREKFTNLSINISKLLENDTSTSLMLYYKDYNISYSASPKIYMTSSSSYNGFENKSFESVNEYISFVKTL